MEALVAHREQEDTDVEVRLPGGAWDDVVRLVTPLSLGWTAIADYANQYAADLDPETQAAMTEFERGTSHVAHQILRMIASAEHAVQNRNA